MCETKSETWISPSEQDIRKKLPEKHNGEQLEFVI